MEIVIRETEGGDIEIKSDVESTTGQCEDENESDEYSDTEDERLIQRREEESANADDVENNIADEDESEYEDEDEDDDENPLFDYEYLKQPLYEGSNVTLAEAII